MFDFIPFAGSRREVAHLDAESGLIGQVWVQCLAFLPPPTLDRGHRKLGRVVIGPDIDEAAVALEIVNAIRIGSWHRGLRKIVAVDASGPLTATPLAPFVLLFPDQFLFLCIHGDDRPSLRQGLLDLPADMLELRVTVGMILACFGLPVALQTVA